jgi:Na+-transporting NADH:ubiquinone oxidoreductase subunit B
MKIFRKMLDMHGRLFRKGSKLEKLYPVHEALDTFFFTPGKVTSGPSHVRDSLDLKRMMFAVVIALIPCAVMALYNTGYQANLALSTGYHAIEGWRASLIQYLGISFSPDNVFACFVHGALVFLPVTIVVFAVGGTCEVIFAVVRKHEINEGFLVTGALIPLIMPPTVPLFELGLGTAFGVVIGKEIFGGTGMNVLNPALTARAFLFFAYPQHFSGDFIWVADADGYSGATWLARLAVDGKEALAEGITWSDAFLGFIPGSMGETSTLACILGAVFLLATQVASWRTMLSVVVGSGGVILLFNALAPYVDNPLFDIPIHWHFVLGGWAFGTVFMATDPVSSAFTYTGKYLYGFGIGVLSMLIRVVNPAFPEGIMLSILFMNVFAPFIDHFVVRANIKRRAARNAAA